MPNVPKKVAERLSKQLRRFQRILRSAKDRDVNESDTVTIIVDMLEDLFGFDKYTDVTSEQEIRGTYCDLSNMARSRRRSIKYLRPHERREGKDVRMNCSNDGGIDNHPDTLSALVNRPCSTEFSSINCYTAKPS